MCPLHLVLSRDSFAFIAGNACCSVEALLRLRQGVVVDISGHRAYACPAVVFLQLSYAESCYMAAYILATVWILIFINFIKISLLTKT